MDRRKERTLLIKQEAARLGFQYCGVASAEYLSEEARQLEKWLARGLHGRMSYMENYFDKRVDPTKLVDGARSVVSLLYNYYTPVTQKDPDTPKISKYALGHDYHDVIRDKLKALLAYIRDHIGAVDGRVFVDSAPVMDKVWARKSGLGWIGKHTNLINKDRGSYFFIGELILDLDLEPDGPVKDHCGDCTACLDACPTEAITAPYEIDGSKCISYFTIELKEEIPVEMKGRFDNWMFGCDVCQEVCPWNRFAEQHREPLFEPLPGMLDMDCRDWQEMTEEVFKELLKHSPLKRAKYRGIQRNLRFLED